MEKLKECPFCPGGGDPVMIKGFQTEDGRGARPFYCRCNMCGSTGPAVYPEWKSSEQDKEYSHCAEIATTLWNCRYKDNDALCATQQA